MNQDQIQEMMVHFYLKKKPDYKSLGVISLKEDYKQCMEELDKMLVAYGEIYKLVEDINDRFQGNTKETSAIITNANIEMGKLKNMEEDIKKYHKQLSESIKTDNFKSVIPQDVHSGSLASCFKILISIGFEIVYQSLTNGYRMFDHCYFNIRKNMDRLIKLNNSTSTQLDPQVFGVGLAVVQQEFKSIQ